MPPRKTGKRGTIRAAGSTAELTPRICAVIQRIPEGRVATYGQVAALAGLPRRARMVGAALSNTPEDLALPWQRVINAGGTISRRSGLGVEEGYQRHLLQEEGVVFDARGRIDLERFGWDPDAKVRSPRQRNPTPEVSAIETALRAYGTPERAVGSKAYLKSDLDFLGVTIPDLRVVLRGWLAEHRDLDRSYLLRLVEALWKTRSHELRTFGVELLRARASLLRSEDADLLEDLLRRSYTWAFVDEIAVHLMGPLVERDAHLNRRLDRWAKDKDFWIRRSALLALLLPLRRGEGDWPRFVRYADRMLEEKEFFIRKAIGWVLREVAKKHPDRVREFLRERSGRVSGVTRREAERYL
jgi:alkylated DNA nucleotide flippase Atl1/3-methyladenine DNA glycosylase AlkD